MKKNMAKMLAFLLMAVMVLAVAGCASGNSIVGKYKRENNQVDYIELKDDKTFVLVQDNETYKGQYQMEGNKLTLKGDNGMMASGTVEGDTITDDDAIKWKK